MRGEAREIAMKKRLIRDEKGYILIAALLVLLVVGLISGPVLSYMVSGLRAGHVFETGAAELYAADGGVTYALWKIKDSGLCPGNLPQSYPINVDGKSVAVNITNAGGGTYKVISNATTGNNSHTTVVAYVDVTFTSFLDNAITSNGDVWIQNKVTVNGTVQYGGNLDNKGTINGQNISEKYPKWPTAGELSTRYWEDVKNVTPWGADSLDVKDYPNPGPLQRTTGNLNLAIYSSVKDKVATLQGTVYVKGNLDIGKSQQDFTLDLNGKTIYCEGDIYIGPGITLRGSGCIIAKGNIQFQPNMQSVSSDFVLVMSLEKNVTLQPSGGTFYGSIAGTSVESDIDLKVDVVWEPIPAGGINFPTEGYETVKTATISNWEVSRQ